MNIINPQFQSVIDFAKTRGFKKCAVYKMIKDPSFPVIKVGKKFYIDTDKFDRVWLPNRQSITLKGV